MESNFVLQVGVKVLLRNSEGKYLLLHRSSAKYPEIANPWDIVGGRIEPGTLLIDNLKREVFEETKLQLEDAPVLIAAQDIIWNNNGQDKHTVRLTYTATISGQPELDPENDEYRWLTIAEMKKLEGLDKYLSQLLIDQLEK